MKKKDLSILLSLGAVLFYGTGCSRKQNGPSDGDGIKQGTLYYSAANALTRYDFQSKQELTLFSDGDHYRISPDAKRFTWYKNYFADGTTKVQVHDLSAPSKYETIMLPYILENTPQFARGTNNLYAALARAEDGAIKRKDLILFSNGNENAGHIPHVKDFAFLPNGEDLVISAEALNAQGEAIGYALVVVKSYRSENNQHGIIIHKYPDYAQLPQDIAVSPDGNQIVFTHLDHLYTVDVRENATPKQITQSRFRETDAAWSADGQYIVFTGNAATPSDCGEIRIISAHPQDPVTIPEDGFDNEPVDPLQPVNKAGKVIHACGTEPYTWL